MPELPEVETVARDLARRIIGKSIGEVVASGKALRIGSTTNPAALSALSGGRFAAVSRRGKYLLLELADERVLLVHLGMTGRLEVMDAAAPVAAHTHLILPLGGASSAANEKSRKALPEHLRFSDPRRFGSLSVYERKALRSSPELSVLGIEPLAEDFTVELLASMLKKTHGVSVKDFLMAQRWVAGIGNIYASEILFSARIRPKRAAYRLRRAQVHALWQAIRSIIADAIVRRGTTFRDYVDTWGNSGTNQLALKVFQREGEPCLECQTPVARFVSQGRSTFWCRTCQR